MIVSFLKSPELKRLREESERHLADGKEVKFMLYLENGNMKKR
jgi:hypothetical protein